MTIDEHGEQHRPKNWRRYHESTDLSVEVKQHIATVRGMAEKSDGLLHRGHVRDSFNTDIEQGIVAAIMWGYPKGKFPGGRGFEPIFKNLKNLTEVITTLKNTSCLTATDACAAMRCVPGMGPSTYTKILHFSGVNCVEGTCLIYDQMVMRAIAQSIDPLWAAVKSALGARDVNSRAPFSLMKHVGTYGVYLTVAGVVATANGITPDQVELDMFNLAPRGRLAKAELGLQLRQ